MKVIIEIDQSDPTQTVIANDNGDTYTFSNPEQFNDFLYGSKNIELLCSKSVVTDPDCDCDKSKSGLCCNLLCENFYPQ